MKRIIPYIVLLLTFSQCKKEDNFTIAKDQIGKVTSLTQVHELKEIFAKDSLVANLGEGDFANAEFDEYLVYDKKGKHLLTLVSKEQHDSTSVIDNVQIFDERYKTAKGLHLSSVFKDIIGEYSVDKVESTFTTAVLIIDELNVTIAIDKKELGINDFGVEKIRLDQIPDMAKIKYFTIWFD